MFIPDPGSELSLLDPGSKRHRIPELGSGSATKNFSIFNPQELLHSSWKYDTGCLFWFPDQDCFLTGSWIQGSKNHRIPDPQHWIPICKSTISSGNVCCLRGTLTDCYVCGCRRRSEPGATELGLHRYRLLLGRGQVHPRTYGLS
jgi:hypothetical protein